MTQFTADDIELCLVREFAIGRETFGERSTREQRREKMRVAILKADKANAAFFDSGMTYGEAYRACYGSPLDMRRTVRARTPPIADVIDSLDEEDELDGEDDERDDTHEG